MANVCLSVEVDDGKYEFRLYEGDWKIHVLRYGEPWLVLEQGHKAILCLMYAASDAAAKERKP